MHNTSRFPIHLLSRNGRMNLLVVDHEISFISVGYNRVLRMIPTAAFFWEGCLLTRSIPVSVSKQIPPPFRQLPVVKVVYFLKSEFSDRQWWTRYAQWTIGSNVTPAEVSPAIIWWHQLERAAIKSVLMSSGGLDGWPWEETLKLFLTSWQASNHRWWDCTFPVTIYWSDQFRRCLEQGYLLVVRVNACIRTHLPWVRLG